MLINKFIALLLILLAIGNATPTIVCFHEIAASTFRRLVEYDCIQLKNDFLPLGIDVLVLEINFNNTATMDASLDVAGNNPDVIASIMSNNIISVTPNNQAYSGIVRAAMKYPSKKWIASRMPTLFNQYNPPNVLFLEYFEAAVWFIKGALAGLMSTSNNFIIMIPQMSAPGFFINQVPPYFVNSNCYYAGLLSVNSAANLTAVYGTFGFNDEDKILNYSLSIYPDLKVFAHFASQANYPGKLASRGLLGIESQLSVNSPQSDFNALLQDHILTLTLWNVLPLWKATLLSLVQGNNLTRTLTIASETDGEELVKLSRISPIVPPNIKKQVLKLQRNLITKNDMQDPQFLSNPYLKQVFKGITLIPNDLRVSEVTLLENAQLHPDIHFANSRII